MDMTDAQVIEQIRAGNIDKFEILVDRYATKTRSFIKQRLFDKNETDDLVQNSFIQLYKSLARFDTSKPIYPYLLQIARNELYMYFRKHHKMIPLQEDAFLVPTKETSTREDTGIILQGLKKENRMALSWFAEGYSYKEISLKLNKPINTVRTLIRRARLYIQKNYTHE